MKTNCELPLCMLDRNKELNGIDFVLFHLFAKNERYKEYYMNLRRTDPNRIMILDNSAYEFFVTGEQLDMGAFVQAINELQPNYYLLPDTLMNKEKTLKDTLDFLYIYEQSIISGPDKPQPMVVAQGMTVEDLVDCMNVYKEAGLTNLCVPFHNAFFAEHASEHILDLWRAVFGKLTEDMKYAAGRVQFVLDHADELSGFNYVHLLGSHNPYEKRFYEMNVPNLIDSMDTGYPVKVGVQGMELFLESSKPTCIIDEFLETEFSTEQQELIANNVLKFVNL